MEKRDLKKNRMGTVTLFEVEIEERRNGIFEVCLSLSFGSDKFYKL